MTTHRDEKLHLPNWPSITVILCTLAMFLNGCTRPSPVSAPPPGMEKETPSKDSHQSESTQEVETQLLDTVKSAESLGDGNPLLMSSLFSLASFYEQQGEFEKAERQYQRALSIKEKTSGPTHPDVALILNKYAGMLRQAQRNEEADHLSRRASEILANQSSPPL